MASHDHPDLLSITTKPAPMKVAMPSAIQQPAYSNADLEKAAASNALCTVNSDQDVNSAQHALATWPHDPSHPQNWARRRKWKAICIISAFTFLSPIASSIIAPSLPDMQSDLHISRPSAASMCLTIFVLGFAFGPLLLAPLSELYGRSPVLQLSNAFFIAFNTACGFARTEAQMLSFRLLAGVGGSASLALGPAVVADLFAVEERGLAIAIYSFVPILGPAVGPLCGGFVAQYSTWRWGFWATSLLSVPVLVAGVGWLEETYAPVLLGRKRADADSDAEGQESSPWKEIGRAMLRPLRLLTTQPIIIVMGIYQAYLYGLMYIVLTTFPTMWQTRYQQSVSIGGLNYISLGLGYCFGIQLSGHTQDYIYRALTRRKGAGQPEFRILMLMPVSLLVLPAGFLIYGWAAQFATHWIVPNIGAFIFAAGIMMGFNSLMPYILDSYPTYAASAAAATIVLRCVAGFVLPLGAGGLYERLGWGWGNTLLGALACGPGTGAAVGVWVWGPGLRGRSRFACQ